MRPIWSHREGWWPHEWGGARGLHRLHSTHGLGVQGYLAHKSVKGYLAVKGHLAVKGYLANPGSPDVKEYLAHIGVSCSYRSTSLI